MSLSITATNDRVDIGKASVINNLGAGTILMWCYPTDVTTANRRMVDKNGGSQRMLLLVKDSTNGDLRFGYNRSVSSLNLLSATGFVTINADQFLGACWDTSLLNANQHLWRGTLTTPPAEPSYTTQVVGSGTHDDSAADMTFGNTTGGGTNQFSGRISWVGIWNRQLTSGEILDQWMFPHVTSGCVYFSHLGFNSTATQPDWSGNGNAGTVTGCSQAQHAPIGTYWGRQTDSSYVLRPYTVLERFHPRGLMRGVFA